MSSLSALPIALAAALLVTPLVRYFARRRGFIARPKDDRWHRRPTALLGGIAVFLAAVPAALLAGRPPEPFAALGAASVVVFLVGLVDDLVTLRPVTKLALQVAAASLAVWGGVSLGWTQSLTLDALLTIFWLIGITNAFNLIDNMDGACAGVGTIAAASVAAIAILSPGVPAIGAMWAAALAGSLLGFLVFNLHPASIFLGDCGSLFIGFLLAGLTSAVGADVGAAPFQQLALPVLVLAVPIFDTTLVTVARKLSGRRASVGGTDHTAHRLVRLGFSERRAVLLLFALASLSGIAGVALVTRNSAWELLAGVLVLTLGLLAAVLLGVRVYGNDFSVLFGGPVRVQLTGFLLRHNVFEVLFDVGLIASAYYVSYRLRFGTAVWPIFFETFLRTLPIVIASQLLSLLAAGAYGRIWRYFSLADFFPIVKGVALGSGVSVLLLVYLYRFEDVSRGVLVIDAVLLTVMLAGSRLVFRALPELAGAGPGARRAVICGAGDAGEMLVREIGNNRQYGYRPVAFVDDDPRKAGQRVRGVPVVGGVAALEDLLATGRADTVIVSSSRFAPEALARVSEMARAARVPVLRFRCSIEELPSAADLPRSSVGRR
jgi:UDP-GlcNAc:undecaprenyl-phosphate GlcNAc-1-phosphate transferase